MTDSTPATAATEKAAFRAVETTFAVRVGVSETRPPRLSQWRRVIVSAVDLVEAQLVACQISACTSVMPVAAIVEGKVG